MEIKLVRVNGTKGFTEGKLYINDVFECYTIEDEDRHLESGGTKIQDKTAIPKGTYSVIWSFSNHFQKEMPLLLAVPNFEGVRIHAGNSSKDTEGCIIVGKINDKTGDDWVSSSKLAVDSLYSKIKQAFLRKEKIALEIV